MVPLGAEPRSYRREAGLAGKLDPPPQRGCQRAEIARIALAGGDIRGALGQLDLDLEVVKILYDRGDVDLEPVSLHIDILRFAPRVRSHYVLTLILLLLLVANMPPCYSLAQTSQRGGNVCARRERCAH